MSSCSCNLRSRYRHVKEGLHFDHSEETDMGPKGGDFWKMYSVEWDIGMKDFEGWEECFISQGSGREQTSITTSLFLVSFTAVDLFRPPISGWFGILEQLSTEFE